MRIKPVFILTVFIILLNFVYVAGITTKLDQSTYGPQDLIKGNLSVNIDGIPAATKLVLELNGQEQEYGIGQACSTTPHSYSIIEANIANPSVIFDSAGTNTNYGFDLNTESSASSQVTITSFNLQLSGAQKQLYPTSPTLDVNSDGIIDWEYIGPLIIENGNIKYIEVQPAYLFSYVPSLESSKPLTKDIEYCENITLPLSSSYKIKTFVKAINPEGALKARIRDINGNFIYNSTGGKAECLIERTNSPSDYAWKSCELNNSNFQFIKQNKNYMVCVYSANTTSGTHHYYMAYQSRSAVNKGYICSTGGGSCSYANELDYFIVADYGDFTREFNADASLAHLKDIVNTIGCSNKVTHADGNVHCVIPLKFSSKSDGIINILNPSIGFNVGSIPTLDSNPISKIAYTPKSFNCEEPAEYYFDIDFPDFLTPSEKGDYELTIELRDGSSIISSKTQAIKVKPAPSVFVSYPKQVNLNYPVQFNLTVNGESPFNYSWDFGDDNKSNLKDPVHVYKNIGDYNITLVVTDKNGISESTNLDISVMSAKDTLHYTLNSTRSSLTELSTNFNSAAGSTAEVIEILKLKTLMTELTFNLTKYEIEFKEISDSATKSESAKEQEYSSILQNLLALRSNVPNKLDVLSITYDSKLNSYNEVPDSIIPYGSSGSYKQDVFELQDGISVTSSAYSVAMEFLDGGKEDFRLVKKLVTITINGQDLSIIEYIPKSTVQSITDKDILTPGFTIIEQDPIIKWPANSLTILYKLDPGSLDSLIDTKTFLFSGSGEIKSKFENEPECGDGICDIREEGYCDMDCRPKYPWLFFAFLALLVVVGVWYINCYTGKWNFRELANLISVKIGKKRLFTNEQDLLNLEKYVRYSLNKGVKEEQLRPVLARKGWKKEQLDFIFRKFKKQ